MNTTIRLSRFVHLYENERYDQAALYHAVKIMPIYIDIEALSFIRELRQGVSFKNLSQTERDFTNQLIDLGFAIDNEHPEIDLTMISSKFKPTLSTMYLILTDECNLACKYCFVESNFPEGYSCSKMNWEVAKQSIDVFVSQRDRKFPGELWLYGGEPLIQSDLLIQILDYIAIVDPDLQTIMVTNATLVTDKIAKQLQNYSKLQIAISVDGPQELHDQMRVTKGGYGSYKATMAGLHKLKKAGCNIGISCTLGEHNVTKTKEIAEWLQNELSMKNFGMNLLIDTPITKVTDEYIKSATQGLIGYFQIARESGVFESRIMRKVNAFTNTQPHWHDCAACGSQMVISPEGKIGICHEGLGERKFFMGSIFDDYVFNDSPLAQEWAKRSPINMAECHDCSALGICGGGCPYGAMLRYGSIWDVDRRFCVHAKDTLEWLIWDLFEKMQES